MIHKTRGIVLRTVKYGETSVIVSIYTELFGLQSYIVNGVRKSSKKGPGKANLFQPAALLDLVVYHNDLHNLQRLKEFKWSYLYETILSDIRKNTVALYMIELLQKTIKQPESNADLYAFIEDAFMHLDRSNDAVAANFALFFALHLTFFFGFRLSDSYSEKDKVLDLQEGIFISSTPSHGYYLDGQFSYTTSQLLKVRQPHELEEIRLNAEMRRTLLQAYEHFYALHVPGFGSLRSMPVLQEILS
ncbi:MAG TPA: DNA repair protein RecO [Chitinophagaceae bacterium]|nr:DNA repair protein RecO [Chitinophagaceae bacterium]